MARKKIQNATDQRPFIMIYQDFLESDLLNNYYQKLIFIYLKKFADSNNHCFPSIKKLAKLTKISPTKIKQTLIELEEKGVISKINRNRPNGGKSSNLYTLYDFAEIWKVGSSENTAAVAEEVSEAKMIAILRAKGYTVTKEKEPDTSHADQSNDESSTSLNQYNIDNNIQKKVESQERYSLDELKKHYDYDLMIRDFSSQADDIDGVLNILHTVLNTNKPTIRIAGSDLPAEAVIAKLMKLDYSNIMYVIEKYQERTDRIKNPAAYMLTSLYNAKEYSNFDITNQVQHDMANWKPKE